MWYTLGVLSDNVFNGKVYEIDIYWCHYPPCIIDFQMASRHYHRSYLRNLFNKITAKWKTFRKRRERKKWHVVSKNEYPSWLLILTFPCHIYIYFKSLF